MATYLNTSENTAALPGQGLVAAGVSVARKHYVYPLPAAFELIEHSDAPWDTLFADVIDNFETLSGLEKYRQLRITNNSADVLEVIANGRTAKPMYLLHGATETIVQDKEIGQLDIVGSGDGKVYILGWL